MRYSDKVMALYEQIKDYRNTEPMTPGIRDDAPEEIKKKWKEFNELADKEYRANMGM